MYIGSFYLFIYEKFQDHINSKTLKTYILKFFFLNYYLLMNCLDKHLKIFYYLQKHSAIFFFFYISSSKSTMSLELYQNCERTEIVRFTKSINHVLCLPFLLDNVLHRTCTGNCCDLFFITVVFSLYQI